MLQSIKKVSVQARSPFSVSSAHSPSERSRHPGKCWMPTDMDCQRHTTRHTTEFSRCALQPSTPRRNHNSFFHRTGIDTQYQISGANTNSAQQQGYQAQPGPTRPIKQPGPGNQAHAQQHTNYAIDVTRISDHDDPLSLKTVIRAKEVLDKWRRCIAALHPIRLPTHPVDMLRYTRCMCLHPHPSRSIP